MPKYMPKIAIIGLGYVGSAYRKLFPEAVIYDPDKGYKDKRAVNRCDLAIVCVPTPSREDGSCDTSIVEKSVAWLKTPLILIKSTVPPGTTKSLNRKYKLNACFSPEYVGEGNYYVAPWEYPDPTEVKHHTFVIIGGAKESREKILAIFQKTLGPSKIYFQTDSTTAEFIKYFENIWGAAKVTLCNEIYEAAKKFGVDYNEAREGLLLDSRVERMHTLVFPEKRGWSGKCYPKDLLAFIRSAEKKGFDPRFLKSIWDRNLDFVLGFGKEKHGNPEWASEHFYLYKERPSSNPPKKKRNKKKKV